MNKIDIKIRKMLPEDIAGGMRLKTLAGWNQTEQDWKLYLKINPEGCFCAESNDKIVGVVTTIPYGNSLTWIGMMLVNPAFRRRGIASRLMNHALEWLKGFDTIKLDATPLGEKVYERLGFEVEYAIIRMAADKTSLNEKISSEISPITGDDFTDIAEMDSMVFGADRMPVLISFARNNPETAYKIIRNNRLTGYNTGRPGTKYYQIGPIAAITTDDAVKLVGAVLSRFPEYHFVIDVPAARKDFLDWLKKYGFREERRLTRMFSGSNKNPGKPENVYAISGPELG